MSTSSALGNRVRQYEQFVSDARTAARHFGHFLPHSHDQAALLLLSTAAAAYQLVRKPFSSRKPAG